MEAGDLRSGSCGGVHCALFPGTPLCVSLANCDIDALVQPSPEQVEAYELYTHLPELRRLWRTKLYPYTWPDETTVRPALHSLEMVFRMISIVLTDTRPYIDRDEWLRRLESLGNMQLEILSCIVEGDDHAPTTKLYNSLSYVGPESVVWYKSGSRPVVSSRSQESLLPRLAAWKTAQSVGSRLHFAIEGHMARAPFTLGLGEPNLAGKPVLEYDKVCRPLEVRISRIYVSPCTYKHFWLCFTRCISEFAFHTLLRFPLEGSIYILPVFSVFNQSSCA